MISVRSYQPGQLPQAAFRGDPTQEVPLDHYVPDEDDPDWAPTPPPLPPPPASAPPPAVLAVPPPPPAPDPTDALPAPAGNPAGVGETARYVIVGGARIKKRSF
ncbi:MAG: hypothetical protein AB1758_24310 [Candidatus Eremiobacterota bacterium]